MNMYINKIKHRYMKVYTQKIGIKHIINKAELMYRILALQKSLTIQD